ncbi:hypothetical protein [Sandaracinobacteroides saxicola]|uniref:Uncharacterized protein n=1 Tax=Sandaracinobacteroides saxicola TaxID=2759707 RepID=A0A7G5IG18_9SPHN|nr:hypothetical protein [Sandaracinobacteroides saxicola]QMW22310.1 hypothetical protein H3309_13250 [Sandaracinobacteroides saxicola]
MSLDRFAKGKRPAFYPTEGMDTMMSMILVLATELSAMRDRLDTVERVARDGGLAEAIEAFVPDQATLEAREKRRQELLARLYYLPRKEAAELAAQDDDARYGAVLTDIAAGRMD